MSGKLLGQRLADRADRQRLLALADLRAPGGVLARELDLELAHVRPGRLGGHQRTWNVSLYLPICTSSPSSRR